MSIDRITASATFERYFQSLATQQGAVLPDERLAILQQMERELTEQGILPISEGEIAEFNVSNPTYAAILRGDEVTISGQSVSHQKRRIDELPLPSKFSLLLIAFLLPVGVFVGLSMARSSDSAEIVPAVSPATTITPTMAIASAATPTKTLPAPEIIVRQPTITPMPSLTPLPLTELRGSAAPQSTDPASLQLAGDSFILSVGTTNNGIWLPRGAEWLEGSTLRRVIAIPFSQPVSSKINDLIPAVDSVQLRLRSGEVVHYVVREIGRYRRDQIETLASGSPSIAIVLYGEEGDMRTVVVGSAVQVSQLAPTQLPDDAQSGRSDEGVSFD